MPADASIAVDPSSVLQLGGTVSFDTTYDEPHGPHGAVSIKIEAFREDGALIWATAGLVGSVFVLGWPGPSWSAEEILNIPAHGVAKLYYFKGNGSTVVLARCEFEVAAA